VTIRTKALIQKMEGRKKLRGWRREGRGTEEGGLTFPVRAAFPASVLDITSATAATNCTTLLYRGQLFCSQKCHLSLDLH